MKRKAEDNYDRNTVNESLRSQDDRGRNGAMNQSGYNLVQSDHRNRTTGRLFVSPLRRLEQAGKLGWGNIQSLNQSTSDDISRRRIVKLKLPSELLQERSQVIEEGSPEKMEILDNSNILDSKQNLESTTILNDQNITSTSFSIFNNTTAQPQAAPSSTTGFGLFNNVQKETQPIQQAEPVQQTTSIFGSSLQAQKSEAKPASLFQSQSATPQPTSIFASQGGSLFANQKTTTPITEAAEKPKEETEAPKAGGLFGNLSGITGNKPMSGLFNIGSTTAAAPVIEKKESIQEETKTPATEGLQLNTEKSKSFGAAIPSPSGSQSKSLFSSNIKTEGGLPKAGLFGNLMDNKTPASIFGGNNKTPTPATETTVPQTQQAQEQEKPKGGLFGNLSGKTETAPLFGSQQQPKTEMVAEAPAEKPKGGLFGNLTSSIQPSTGTGSLFGSQPKPEATQAPAEKPKSLFGGMVSTQPKTETTSMTVEAEKPKAGGLFGNLSSASQPKTETTTSMETEKPKGGLFSGMVSSQPRTEATPMTVEAEKPKGGLFGQQKAETTPTPVQSTTGGLFANQPKPEAAAEKPKGGLFSGMATSQPKTETTTSMTVEAEKPKGGLFSGMATSQPKAEATPTPAQSTTGGLFGSQPKAETTPTPTQTQAEKPKSIFGGLATSQPKNDSPQRSIQPSSLGSFGHTPAAAQPKKETASPPKPTSESASKPEGTKPGLFSGLASSKPASFLGSVNQTIGKTEESKDQEGGKPGLFANVLGNKPTEGGAKPGLFSGLAPKPFAGFGEQKDTAAGASDKPSGLGVLGGIGGLGTLSAAKGGLFSGGASSGGSFASLFGSGPGKSSGLFNKPAGGNEGKDDEGSEDEDDEEGDDDPEREPSPEADVSKSRGNYQYQQDYEKVLSKKVNKFKPGQRSMFEEGEISLNKKNESYFMIFRDKAKLIRYQGQIIPQVLKTEFLNPRKDALSVTTFSSEDKGEGAETEESKGKPKLSKDLLKIMFGVPEDCEQFKKALDKIAQ